MGACKSRLATVVETTTDKIPTWKQQQQQPPTSKEELRNEETETTITTTIERSSSAAVVVNNDVNVTTETETQYFDAVQSLSSSYRLRQQSQSQSYSQSLLHGRFDEEVDSSTVSTYDDTNASSSSITTTSSSCSSSSCSSSSSSSLEEMLRHDDFMDNEYIELKRPNYPGRLTEEQVRTCLEFKKLLDEKAMGGEPSFKEMVYCFVPVEPEAFALCRFLRARNFDIDETIKMIQDNVDVWKSRPNINQNQNQNNSNSNNNNNNNQNQNHQTTTATTDFTEATNSLENTMGCPVPLLDHEIAVIDNIIDDDKNIVGGRRTKSLKNRNIAKNGAFVTYWQPGRIDLQGSIECMQSSVDEYTPYVWYVLIDLFKDTMERINNNSGSTKVLAESIFVIDLKDLPKSIFTKDVMSFLQVAFSILRCFPEVMNRMVIVNVPRYFTLIWSVLKVFVDPRTVQKIGFFSDIVQAKKDLLRYIDEDQLLSDYGGPCVSFDMALERQMKRHGNYNRYIIERVDTSGKRKSSYRLPAIELEDGESADVMVYTQSRTGAVVSWSRTQSSSSSVQRRLVQNTRGLSLSSTTSTSKNSNDWFDIPQCTAVVWGVSQEGQYECVVSPVLRDQPEHYLVVISIK